MSQVLPLILGCGLAPHLVYAGNTLDSPIVTSLESTGQRPKSSQQKFTIKTAGTSPGIPPYKLSYRILAKEPHIENSFTQGLQLDDGLFYESSGLYGKSYLARYTSGNTMLQTIDLPRNHFAEGLSLLNGRLFLLTWRAGLAYEYQSNNFSLLKTHTYDGEGWGLTTDGQYLIMSNGSNRLRFRDPSDFTISHEIEVHDQSETQWNRLNELEYANNLIWANVWQKTVILAIDPANGAVLGTLDLADLVTTNTRQPTHETLNGIAFDDKAQGFWVTGKLWKYRYLIDITLAGKSGSSSNAQ